MLATAKATSRSVRMPIGWPASTTGTAPQPTSWKSMLASSMVLKAEHVRGLGVITSAAVRFVGVGSGIEEDSSRRGQVFGNADRFLTGNKTREGRSIGARFRPRPRPIVHFWADGRRFILTFIALRFPANRVLDPIPGIVRGMFCFLPR